MVTGSANDRSYCQSAYRSSNPRGAARDSLLGGQVNIRKTALGASSPAKPALHIPDLHTKSALAKHTVFMMYLLQDHNLERMHIRHGCRLYPPRSDVPIVDNEGCNFFYIFADSLAYPMVNLRVNY